MMLDLLCSARAQLADALRAPKRLADSIIGRLPLPTPLREAALFPATILDELSRVLPTIARSDRTDEATLAAFGALWDEVSPRLGASNPSPPSAPASGAGKADTESTDGGPFSFGAFEPPPALASVQSTAGPLLEQLGDSDSRLRQRIPMIGTLSRRFAATLLRRVAQRLEDDANLPDAPGLARTVAVKAAEADRSIAKILEPAQATEGAKA